MNILYLTNHLNTGGISSYLLTLASGMRRKGHNVYLGSSGGDMSPLFEREGVNCLRFPLSTKQEVSPAVLFSSLKAARIVGRHKIDIVHSQTRTTQVAGTLAGAMTGAAHVTTTHGFFKPKLSRRLFPCWGCRTIAVSDEVKEHLVKDFKVSGERIRVINNGIDIDRFSRCDRSRRGEFKAKFGLGTGPVVGIIARLSDVKGHRYLIEALPKIIAIVPAASLLIVGEGDIRKTLESRARVLGVSDYTIFIPSVADICEVLAVMDVFVLPSLQEGLGLALIEAMAAGIAVVGSDIGGIRSLIRHGYNGLLIKTRDPAGIFSAVIRLLCNPDERESLGRQAQEDARVRFPREKMIDQTQEVYEQCRA